MPTEWTFTFGGKPCSHPNSLSTAGVLADELPLWQRANSFTCPRGKVSGVGYFLMRRDYLATIDPNAAQPLVIKNAFETVAFPRLYLLRALTMFGVPGDTRSPMLLEVCDRRQIMAKSAIAAEYNVLVPNPPNPDAITNRYYPESLNGGVLWTWQTMLGNIWSNLTGGGTAPTIPTPPTSVPHSIRFLGCNAWDALHSVLERIGCTTAYNPFADTFMIVKVGDTETVGTAAKLTSLRTRLRQDFDPPLNYFAANLPATVRVYFPKAMQWRGIEADTPRNGNWEMSSYEVKNANTNITGAMGVLPVAGDIWALVGRAGGVENNTALQNRANEIRDDIVRNKPYRAHQMYVGATNKFWPSERISQVLWRDYGDDVGQVTVVDNGFDIPLAQQWAPLTEETFAKQDLGRKTYPVYPDLLQMVEVEDGQTIDYGLRVATIAELPGSASTIRVHPGKVRLLRNGAEILEECMLTVLDDIDGDAGDVILVNKTEFTGRMCGTAIVSSVELPLYGIYLGERHLFGVTNVPLPAGGSGLVTVWQKSTGAWLPTGIQQTVYNPFPTAVKVNSFIYFIWDKTARQWQVITQPGTEATLIRFQMLTNLPLGGKGLAIEIDTNYANVGDPFPIKDPWTSPGMWRDDADFTQVNRHYKGWCLIPANPELVAEDSPGNPLPPELQELEGQPYREIVWMEQIARSITFTATADMAGTALAVTFDNYYLQGKDPGNTFLHGTQFVFDPQNLFRFALRGCKGKARYNDRDHRYEIVTCDPQVYLVQVWYEDVDVGEPVSPSKELFFKGRVLAWDFIETRQIEGEIAIAFLANLQHEVEKHGFLGDVGNGSVYMARISNELGIIDLDDSPSEEDLSVVPAFVAEPYTLWWKFTLSEDMGATIALKATAIIKPMVGAGFIQEVTVRDPMAYWTHLSEGDEGWCLEQNGLYYVMDGPC